MKNGPNQLSYQQTMHDLEQLFELWACLEH